MFSLYSGISTISLIYLAVQSPTGFHLYNKISDFRVTISGLQCKTAKGEEQETPVSSFIPSPKFNYLASVIMIEYVCAHMHKFLSEDFWIKGDLARGTLRTLKYL